MFRLQYLVSMALTTLAIGAHAEISGSGHQVAGCYGEIETVLWNDVNGNGARDAGEPALEGVTVGISLRNRPEEGEDLLTSDVNGYLRFFNLCLKSHLLRVDQSTLPAGTLPTSASATPNQNHMPDESDDDEFEELRIDLHREHAVSVYAEIGFESVACAVSVESSCVVMRTAPRWTHCHDPEELTMIWDGAEAVRVVAHKGNTSKNVMADIDGIQPGSAITVNVDGAPDDVIWQIFRAGTSEKIGESSFDLSCSDPSMDGIEDCGTRQGDGQDNDQCDGDCINDWLLEGVVDKHGIEKSLSCTFSEPPAESSCAPESGDMVSYRYVVRNAGSETAQDLFVSDTVSGLLSDVTGESLAPGASRTYVSNATAVESGTPQVIVTADDGDGMCIAEGFVPTDLAPPPPCEISGEPEPDLSHDKFKWKVTNDGDAPATLAGLVLSWPAENENLKEAKFAGEKVWTGEHGGGAIEIGAEDLQGDVDKRQIDAGKEETLEIKFSEHHHGDQQLSQYGVTVIFAEGCQLSYDAP